MSNETVLFWNEKAATVLNIHTNPGDDCRRFAIIHIAIHDAINSIKPKYWSYSLRDEKQRFASVDAAVSKAASLAIKWAIGDVKKYVEQLDLLGLNVPFTNNIAQWASDWHTQVDSWYEQVNPQNISFEPTGAKARRIAGENLGKKSFDAIIANRSNDGRSDVAILSSTPAEGVNAGEFQGIYYSIPAPPTNKFFSNWGAKVQPFVLPNNFMFRQGGPHNIKSAEYTKDYIEVKDKGRVTNSTRNASETELVDVWNNLNQHIVWNNYAVDIIKTRMDAWETARTLALIHTAMADGSTSMFNDVYHFNHWRPKTAITFPNDGNNDTTQESGWQPFKQAPRVPEYPSTFGILGSATGQILRLIFPNDSLLDAKISKAVVDNAESKIFCGWNFRKSAVDGIEQGRLIGNYVFDNIFRPRSKFGFFNWWRFPKLKLPRIFGYRK